MLSKRFSKFKYAEEFCQELTSERFPWQLTVQYDMPHVEDGEVYIYDEFVVDWIPEKEEL
jgi:hypothetical protein